jgi:hypothetical protein
LKSGCKDGFFGAPFNLFKFCFLEGTMAFLKNLKGQKTEETAQYFKKTGFYKQILDFHSPSKMLCHALKL